MSIIKKICLAVFIIAGLSIFLCIRLGWALGLAIVFLSLFFWHLLSWRNSFKTKGNKLLHVFLSPVRLCITVAFLCLLISIAAYLCVPVLFYFIVLVTLLVFMIFFYIDKNYLILLCKILWRAIIGYE